MTDLRDRAREALDRMGALQHWIGDARDYAQATADIATIRAALDTADRPADEPAIGEPGFIADTAEEAMAHTVLCDDRPADAERLECAQKLYAAEHLLMLHHWHDTAATVRQAISLLRAAPSSPVATAPREEQPIASIRYPSEIMWHCDTTRPPSGWITCYRSPPSAKGAPGAVHDAYVEMCALVYPHRRDGEDEMACLRRVLAAGEPVAAIREFDMYGRPCRELVWLDYPRDSPSDKWTMLYAAPPPVAAPAEGWKLVPVEPMPEQIHACMRTGGEPYSGPSYKIIAELYRMMVEVAPTFNFKERNQLRAFDDVP